MKFPWRNPQRDTQRDAELDAELQSHLDETVRERTDRGESVQQALDAARKEFGNFAVVKETTRQMWGWRWLDSLSQDLRFAIRTLRKSPVFAATAIVTLALAIGANTAIFSIIDSLVLRPLPYTEPGQLATVGGHIDMGQGISVFVEFSSDTWNQVRQQTPAIERMALWEDGSATLSGLSAPESISAVRVSGDFFPLLGAKTELGRPILPADTIPGNKRVALLTYKLWRETFGGDRGIAGKNIFLDGKPYEVIGVMARDVNFHAEGRALWTPLLPDPRKPANQDSDSVNALVRMKQGTTLSNLNEQLKVVTARVVPHFNGLLKRAEFRASEIRGGNRRAASVNRGMLILLGAVGFVLLIACVNVSNLLLARGWSRQREMAIRTALGASRGRLVRQLVAEGTALALAGFVGALALGAWTLRILRVAAPAQFLGNNDVRIDVRVLLFTLGISLVAGIAFALAPAWQISAADPRSAMSQATGSGAGIAASSRRPQKLRAMLVVFEVALAMVLVFGAALLLRSFENLMSRETGMQTDHVLAVSAKLSKSTCDRSSSTKESIAACNAVSQGILDRLRGIPGVDSSAAVSSIPLEPGSVTLSIEIEGRSGEVGLEQGDPIGYRDVSPGYFKCTGIRVLQGRDFSPSDAPTSQDVAIVNQDFASKFFPQGALGSRFRLSSHSPWIEVVGIVAASHDTELGHDSVPEYYLPLEQTSYAAPADYLLRTGVDPSAIAPAVRAQIWSVDRNAPVEIRTLGDVMREQEAEPRFRAILLTSFASLGLLLAMIGLYGVISYGVSQRTHEIGVRSALGAAPRSILLMILREAMTLVVAGIGIGIAAGVALGRLLGSLLYEIKAGDPLTFAIVGVALALVALAACYVPAHRAMRVDPMQALRYE